MRLTPLITVVVLASAASTATAAQVIDRVSLNSGGVQGNGNSERPSISMSGRFVAFDSLANNLVPGDTNIASDIFVRDRQAGVTERVSVSSGGAQASAPSFRPKITSDGRFVVWDSSAPDLVPSDTNGVFDVFVRDRSVPTTTRASLNSAGVEGNNLSTDGTITSNGTLVAFRSGATNLVPADANFSDDAFVRNLAAGTTIRASVDGAGTEGDADSSPAWIGAAGRFVAFESNATNLLPADTNGETDIFVRDFVAGLTTRENLGPGGVEGNNPTGDPVMSADGRFVVFRSDATNLVAGDTNGAQDIFVRDRTLGVTARVSVSSAGVEGNATSDLAQISADGRFVAFESNATNLVPGDANGAADVFVRDLTTQTTVRVSITSGGVEGNSNSVRPSLSADGRFVTFASDATNLVPGDTNGVRDVFVALNPLAPPVPLPFVQVCRPIGTATSGGARMIASGSGLSGVVAVRLGNAFPAVSANASGVVVLNDAEVEFTMPALSPGQKFVEVLSSSGETDEIRNAVTSSGSIATGTLTILPGSTVAGYRMRSLPLFAGAKAELDELTTCLGPYDPRRLRAFVWDGPTQQYTELPALALRNPDEDLSGRGFFILTVVEGACGFVGLSTDPASNFYLLLEPGWNMVALPSTTSVAWPSVRVGDKGEGSTGANDVPAASPNPFIYEVLFAFDGVSYVSASAMVEGEAYWVLNRSASRKVLFVPDPLPKAGDEAQQSYAPLPADAPVPPPPPGAMDGVTSESAAASRVGGGDSAAQVAGRSAAGALALAALIAVLWRRTSRA